LNGCGIRVAVVPVGNPEGTAMRPDSVRLASSSAFSTFHTVPHDRPYGLKAGTLGGSGEQRVEAGDPDEAEDIPPRGSLALV
jgi:hypothetical protein